MIYTDSRSVIKKLIEDKRYNLIAEVWKYDRLIAGLFCCLEVSE
jgi:hypothetical protein